MNLINFHDKNERLLDIKSLGLMGLKLSIPSPSYETVTQKVDGQSGVIVLERILQSRKLSARFVSQASNYQESLLLRDDVYGLLGNGDTFYVSESEHPTKRWKVYLDEWTPERFDAKTQIFEIPLLCSSGTSESVSMIRKKFSTSSFRFKNEGNQLIDPRKYHHSETEIIFSGTSSNLVIRNMTTGDEWSWTGTTVSGDVVSLKGVKALKNGISIFGQSNKKIITLSPGWNSFEISGTTGSGFELTIQTRFHFL